MTATVRTWDHSFACGIHDDRPCTCKEDQPVSGATYRIDVEHDPGVTSAFQWCAIITRLSDDYRMAAMWSTTDDEAMEKAQEWLRAQNAKKPGRSLLVNDEGEAVTS